MLQKITNNIPLVTINKCYFQFPANIKLADPTFHVSSPVDILIGASLLWDLLCVGQIRSESHPLLQKTQFGCLVTGKVLFPGKQVSTHCNHLTNETMNKMLERFLTLNESFSENCFSEEERKCENYFKDTTDGGEHGRFIVKLPFKLSPLKSLGDSKAHTLKCFYALDKKI